MKELTATFHSEVFRPVVTLIVPGFYAISTICLSLLQHFPQLKQQIDAYPSVAALVFLLVVLTVGLITEEAGARIEINFDRVLRKRAGYENRFKEWFAYLRLAFEKEPVGHRYLRSLVLRLKFELGMTIATVPFWLGTLTLFISWFWRSLIIAISALLAVYLLFEARCSNETLSELRREMLMKDWS
jgi:hypothetical protein